MSYQVEAVEAINSALYQLAFAEFLGEQDLPEGRTSWWHIGEAPLDMRVKVWRPNPNKSDKVHVKIVWRNYSADARQPLLGEQTLTIECGGASLTEIKPPVEEAVLRVLTIYRDVLSEEGVAGTISDLVETEEETEEG